MVLDKNITSSIIQQASATINKRLNNSINGIIQPDYSFIKLAYKEDSSKVESMNFDDENGAASNAENHWCDFANNFVLQ